MGVVAITGAGSGLGRALAHKYRAAGNTIYLLGRDEQKLLLVQNEIRSSGGSAETVACDITEPASVSIAFEQFDQLDLLINNAGMGIFGALSTYSPDEIDQVIDTNIKGTIHVTQYALPLLEQSNGRIINIISTAGLRGKTNESVYCASKFAVRGFTESLQKEWESKSVSITAAYMGGMNTPFWENSEHVSNPENFPSPDQAAEQIFNQDDRRTEIHIEK
ncbi:SDR family NAD(P)-dependent oxidoreductase [Sediminibacillus albus]|uniref:Short-chain dehydrogenase n=1 Tax=Sediminibacillus albus TaxID=407036 RepID=A0A1G9B3I6_9BACI|nr:SDR family NAD(P)-dependent oxidoreductase [Sediminibacillus albus]SDK34122.1 Short-chain dehydrogenase [Sediminibacillus albus]